MYDALLWLSFGGPEGPDEVMPFLENVTRGRDVPRHRLAVVAERYDHFGGVSPINAANRTLIEAVGAEFVAHNIELPIYWGNRNWHPFVADTVQSMARDGIRRALVFVTSAYASYSACRQYQEDVAAAAGKVGAGAPEFAKLRHFFDHPGFIDPQVDAVRRAVTGLTEAAESSSRLVFTAHSIPVTMAEQSGPNGGLYVAQLRAASSLIAEAGAPGLAWDLVFQSRSGSPSAPWLAPDIAGHLRTLPAAGVTDVVVVPVGFVSDHLEVEWDLDVEAAQTAADVGLGFVRTPTAGTDPRFAAMVRELVQERLDPAAPKHALSRLGPAHDTCPSGCCLAQTDGLTG
jgi:protoporphyrin/coproporphyrin ferrochelatase